VYRPSQFYCQHLSSNVAKHGRRKWSVYVGRRRSDEYTTGIFSHGFVKPRALYSDAIIYWHPIRNDTLNPILS